MRLKTKEFRALFLTVLMVVSVFSFIAVPGGPTGTAVASHSTNATHLAGASNSDITTSISATAADNISAGSGAQSVGIIRIKDLTNDGNLGDKTVLRMPAGVTISNTITADDLTVTVADANNDTVNLDVTGKSISSDRKRVRIDHSQTSSINDTLRIKGLVLNTTSDATASRNGSRIDITVDYALGSLDSSLLRVHKPGLGSGGNNAQVGAGGSGVVIFNNTLNITTTNVSGQIGANTDIVLYSNASNGVTWDTSLDTSTIINNTHTSQIDIDEANIKVTEDTITIPTNNASKTDAQITFQNLAIDIAGTATNATLSAEVRATNPKGTVTVENEGRLGIINVQKPQVSLNSSGNENVSVGRQSQLLNRNITVTPQTNSGLQAGDNVTIKFNNSGVTFDKSAANIAAHSGDITQTDSVAVTADSLTVNVSETVSSNAVFNFTNVSVNVSSSLANGTAIGFNATTGSGQNVDSSSDVSLIAIRPNTTFNEQSNFTILLGDTGNRSASVPATKGDLNFSENDFYALPNATGSSPVNVTFTIESVTGVTYDQSGTLNVSNRNGLSNGNLSVSITESQVLQVTINGSVNDDEVESFNVSGVALNATSSASNATITATIEPTGTTRQAGNIVVTQDQKTVGTFNKSNDLTVNLDNDASGQAAETNVTVGDDRGDFNVTFGVSDDIPDRSFNITISLPGDTGVSFDQRKTLNSTTNISATTSEVIVDAHTINVTVTNPTPATGGQNQYVQVNGSGAFGIALNVSEDASNTTLTFSLNRTPTGASSADRIVDKQATGQVIINKLTADQVSFDLDQDGSWGDSTNTTNVDRDPTTYLLNVTNSSQSSLFSGAVVDLTVNDTSNGASVPDTTTTNSSGIATFDFSPGTASNATYRINATAPDGSQFSVNVTVDAGTPTDITGERNTNAVNFNTSSGEPTEDVERASIKISLRDQHGNLVTDTNITVDQIALNKSGTIVGGANSSSNATSGVLNFTGTSGIVSTDSDGAIYIVVGAETGTKDLSVTVDISSPVTASVDAPVTVFSDVNQVDVSANLSTTFVRDQNVGVTYTLRDDNGDPITVSGLPIRASSTNSTVMSPSSTSATTNASGQATVTFSATTKGTAKARGIDDRYNVLGSQSFTITNPTLKISTVNVSEMTALTATNVQVNVTFEHNGTAVNNAQVNLTGAGVDTGTQTDANGVATFTDVNADDATEDITVSATKATHNDATNDSISVVRKTVALNVTANDTDVQAGDNVTFTVTREDNDNAVEGATVDVDGATYTADANGEVTHEFAEAGDFTATASNADTQNETYTDDTATVSVSRVSVQLSLTADATSVTAGDTVEFTVTRQDTGAAVDATVTVDGTDHATGSDGTVNVTFDAAGDFEAVASKTQTTSETYQNDSVNVSVERQTVALNVTASETTVEAGDTVTFTVTRDDTGATVDATIEVDGTTLTTGADGEATHTFDSTGTFTATASKDNTSSATFTNDSVDVTVEQATVQLAISADATSVNVGDEVTFTVTDDATGDAIEDATVSVDGTDHTTDANGTVTVTFDSAGDFTATASKADTSTETFLNDSVNVSVTKTEVQLNLTASETTVEVGDTVTFTVTREDTGAAVENATIDVDGATLTTDANGEATLEFDSTGTFTATASEEATDTTTFATDSVDVTVEQAAPDVNDNGEPAQDLNGDGHYEDVNGDGEFSIVDVQLLFTQRDSDAVQNNADLFDFTDNGEFSIADVQQLFVDFTS